MIKNNDIEFTRFFLRSIFATPGLIRELNKDLSSLIQAESEARNKDVTRLHTEEKLSVYLKLIQEKLDEEKSRRSILESKAQSMIGFITFSVTLVSVFLANAHALWNHGIWGMAGKSISIALLATPIFSIIVSGIFARNILITEYRHIYPAYTGFEVASKTQIGLIKQRIKDTNMSIRSYEIFNNFKGTCLKYSHMGFKTAMYSFAVFVAWTMIMFGLGGSPKSKEGAEINELREKVMTLEFELKAIQRQIQSTPKPQPAKPQTLIKNPVAK